MIRWLFSVVVAFVAVATLAMTAYTLFQIARAGTNVPWWDEWARIGELRRLDRGEARLPVLWGVDAGGIRTIVLRLVLIADGHWRALRSLMFAGLGIHCANILLLMAMAVRLIGRGGLALTVLTCAVIVNLCFNPIQMENFVWSGQIQYFLTYAAAAASIALLVFSAGRLPMIGGAIFCGLVSSYSMTNGLCVWPVLVAAGAYLRFKRLLPIAIAAIGIAVIATYFWRYQPASIGMGVSGMVRDPLHAIALLGLVLAGPLDFISTPAAIAVSLAGAGVVGLLGTQALRKSPAREVVFLCGLGSFLFLSCAAMVAGRLDARFLQTPHGLFTLQSRHYTPVFWFWAVAAPLVVWTCCLSGRRPVLLAFFAAVFALLMFCEPRRQLNSAEDWADFFVGVDAGGRAMLLDIPDEQLLSKLWPVASERNTWVEFLRERRLAMFSDGRAGWAGRRIGELFQGPAPQRCEGGIEQVLPAGSGGMWRLQGWALDDRGHGTVRDLIFADAAGQIVGLGRGGFRHNYFPGLMTEPATPPAAELHRRVRHSEWLGYVRQPGSSYPDVRVYEVLAGERLCLVESRN